LLLAALASHPWAQQSDKPVVTSQLQKVEATIEKIDPQTRELSLQGPKGPVSVVVGPEAKNFDQLKVGDKVVLSYYQGIAAQMSKGGVKATGPAGSTFGYTHGTTPGGGAGASITSTVTIEDVNTSTNTVAFRGSDGLVHIVAVKSPDMRNFIRTLKRGDSVDVTYTESIAVSVVPASTRAAGRADSG